MKQISHTLHIMSFLIFIFLTTSAHAVGTFVDNGDGTVSDEVTGLMWQQIDDGITRNWEDACQACEDLELAGYDDWRTPSVEELRSIVDYTMYNQSVSDGVFNNVKSNYYWSSSTHAVYVDHAWHVYFHDGRVGYRLKTSVSYVRCVRSGSYWSFDPLEYLVVKSENIIEDRQRELEWQREDDAVTRTWEASCKYCEDLVLDGYSDWRIPDVEELSTIIDYTRVLPSIPANIFDTVTTGVYWSGSAYAYETYVGWIVSFFDGNLSYYRKNAFYYVRCVRSGAFVPLTFSISASEEDGYAPLVVSFSCTISSGSSPYEYEWDFGDGTQAVSQESPEHTFQSPGTFTVRCTVTDASGQTVSGTIDIKTSETSEKTSKAIIIAGGGPYETNAIWEDTVTCVKIAYRSLRNQGFEEENIYFISPDDKIDLDGDGDLDVDAYATQDEVYNAITDWSLFSNPPDELLIYMADHGGVGKFMLNEYQEWLYASDLDLWLDTIQRDMDVDVILVYDACYSGSFIQYMTPPPGKLRILITSSGPDEAASFADDTLYSFSYPFWAKIIQSGSLYNGFTSGTTQMCGRQTPQIEANWILQDGSDIVPNEKEDKSIASAVRLGKGYALAAVPPVIEDVPDTIALDGSESARLWAGSIITASGGLDRVWAMVIPPDAYSGSADVPVTGLPVVELLDGDSDGVYEALYDGFGKTGTYEVNFFAMYKVISGDLEVEVISDPVMTTVIQTGSETLNIDTPDKYVTMTNDGAVCWVLSGYVYHVYGCQGTNRVVIESGAGA
ncbi:DUF1566 domain-containing protein, partial [Desulfamplus magnetovallimortis]|uniref:Lcl domain-containing protein n=1 Tax=Desulfamplus magnetovallimortis TaxID=1246637 RepID=UPI001118988C